jgi:hypothetical protein
MLMKRIQIGGAHARFRVLLEIREIASSIWSESRWSWLLPPFSLFCLRVGSGSKSHSSSFVCICVGLAPLAASCGWPGSSSLKYSPLSLPVCVWTHTGRCSKSPICKRTTGQLWNTFKIAPSSYRREYLQHESSSWRYIVTSSKYESISPLANHGCVFVPKKRERRPLSILQERFEHTIHDTKIFCFESAELHLFMGIWKSQLWKGGRSNLPNHKIS